MHLHPGPRTAAQRCRCQTQRSSPFGIEDDLAAPAGEIRRPVAHRRSYQPRHLHAQLAGDAVNVTSPSCRHFALRRQQAAAGRAPGATYRPFLVSRTAMQGRVGRRCTPGPGDPTQLRSFADWQPAQANPLQATAFSGSRRLAVAHSARGCNPNSRHSRCAGSSRSVAVVAVCRSCTGTGRRPQPRERRGERRTNPDRSARPKSWARRSSKILLGAFRSSSISHAHFRPTIASRRVYRLAPPLGARQPAGVSAAVTLSCDPGPLSVCFIPFGACPG
jgi:hypothetical protein